MWTTAFFLCSDFGDWEQDQILYEAPFGSTITPETAFIPQEPYTWVTANRDRVGPFVAVPLSILAPVLKDD